MMLKIQRVRVILTVCFLFFVVGCRQSGELRVVEKKQPSHVVFMVSNIFVASIISSLVPDAEVLIPDVSAGLHCDSVGLKKSDLNKLKKSDVLIDAFNELATPLVVIAKRTHKIFIDLNDLSSIKDYFSSVCEALRNDDRQVECSIWSAGLVASNPWIDPMFAIVATKSLSSILSTMFPDYRRSIELRAQGVVKKLSGISEKFELLRKCRKGFFGMHDEYAYVAMEYGLVYHGGMMLRDHSASPISIRKIGALSSNNKICLFMDQHHVQHYKDSYIMKKIFAMQKVSVVKTQSVEMDKNLESYINVLRRVADTMASCLCEEAKGS